MLGYKGPHIHCQLPRVQHGGYVRKVLLDMYAKCCWICTQSAVGYVRKVLLDMYAKCCWICTQSAVGYVRKVLLDMLHAI